jgi:hypothetical protein
LEDEGITPEPSPLNPDDQGWFWTPEWQTMERQADESMARGERGMVFLSGDEFLEFLNSRMSTRY